MKAKLITYDLSDLSQYHKVRVNRELFTHTQYSDYGKYKYEKEGALSNVPHKKILRGAVIVKKEHYKKATSILDKYGADYELYDIIVKESIFKNN